VIGRRFGRRPRYRRIGVLVRRGRGPGVRKGDCRPDFAQEGCAWPIGAPEPQRYPEP